MADVASWWIIDEIVRRHPDWRVLHTHPGGGQYDCLTVVDTLRQPSVWIDINRSGSIHGRHTIDAQDMRSAVEGEWLTRLMGGESPSDLAEHLSRALSLEWPDRRPASTRWSVMYRTLSQVVAQTSGMSHPLTATTWLFDSSGDDGSFLLMPTPHPELETIDPKEVWLVMDGSTPVAWLWDGWAWTASFERLDLFSRYRAGDSVMVLAAHVVDSGARASSDRPSPRWQQR